MIKIYLLNGSHVDLKVPDGKEKSYAEALMVEGVWGEERGEAILYPPSQIFRIRVVKPKPVVKLAPKKERPVSSALE